MAWIDEVLAGDDGSDRQRLVEQFNTAIAAHIAEEYAMVEMACEAALQTGEFGVFLVRCPGHIHVGPHRWVPYGNIRTFDHLLPDSHCQGETGCIMERAEAALGRMAGAL